MDMATVLILGRDHAAAVHEMERTRRASQRAADAFHKADKAATASKKALDKAVTEHLNGLEGVWTAGADR